MLPALFQLVATRARTVVVLFVQGKFFAFEVFAFSVKTLSLLFLDGLVLEFLILLEVFAGTRGMYALSPLSLFLSDERTIPFAAITCVCFYHGGLHFRVKIRLCFEHLGNIAAVIEPSLSSPEALLLLIAVDD